MIDNSAFMDAVAAHDGNMERLFGVLCDLARHTAGAKLFTVLEYDAGRGLLRRAYSNMPDAYPVSGTKPVKHTAWTRHVLRDGNIFVANTAEEVAGAFFDHELIQSLGCSSAVNVPVVVAGEVLGTVNCLHEAGFYDGRRVAAAERLRLPGALCFLLARRAAKSV